MKLVKEITLFLVLVTLPWIHACDCNCDCEGKYKIHLGECCEDDGGVIPEPTCSQCPPGYFAVGDYGCYFVMISTFTEGWTHSSAQSGCKAMNNGRLASMHNSTMFDDVHTEVVKNRDGQFELIWLSGIYHDTGMDDESEFESGFYWGDGRRVITTIYEWWFGMDPAEAEVGYCLYAFGNITHNNCLGYTYCDVGIGYLCEKDYGCHY